MSEELKPCPFCGGEAEVVQFDFCFSVECTVCDTKIGDCLCNDSGWVYPFNSEQKAIKAWNTRSSDKRWERLKAMIDNSGRRVARQTLLNFMKELEERK